uniref:C2H2-type domain-containing protein n=1 Tax=Tetranychus urticae TaxID=32264 RepID=T1JR63_TETUR
MLSLVDLNFRYELAHYNTLNPPSQVTGYTGPIPKGFTRDISKLQDCGNPRHFIDDITEKYRCRWCGHNFSKSSNKVRHEKGCGMIGAPGHKCDIHCHNPAIGLNCVGAGVYTPDKDNDVEKSIEDLKVYYGNCVNSTEATLFLDNAASEDDAPICIFTECIHRSIEQAAGNIHVVDSVKRHASSIKVVDNTFVMHKDFHQVPSDVVDGQTWILVLSNEKLFESIPTKVVPLNPAIQQVLVITETVFANLSHINNPFLMREVPQVI